VTHTFEVTGLGLVLLALNMGFGVSRQLARASIGAGDVR